MYPYRRHPVFRERRRNLAPRCLASDHLLEDPLAGRGGGQPLSSRTRTFLTGAQLFCLCPRSVLRRGWGQEPQAFPGSPAPTTQPQQHLAGPPRTGPPPPRKVQGVIFESAQNSARLLHKSPYYSSSVGSKSGGGCTSAGALVGSRVFGEGDARRRWRLPGAGRGRPGRSGSAGEGGRGAAAAAAAAVSPFPSPGSAGACSLCPQPWTIFVRTTRETEKERIWGGKERRVPI